MILLRLYFEFFKTGLFAVGGGMATIPFLQDMGARTGWFTNTDLTTMLAVSESTPGPIGINMATYVGYQASGAGLMGVLGAVVATLGLITPSIIVIIIIAGFLQRFRQSKAVNDTFSGLRPASTALIASAGLTVASSVLLFHQSGHEIAPGQAVPVTELFYWPAVLLCGAVFVAMKWTPLKKLHPIVFIAFAAAVGVVFQL